jgi:2-hydroxychromene-2-carboxylate isomerase
MAATLEFFFDLLSPYAYLASTRLGALAQRTGAQVLWRPVFLPGLLQAAANTGPTQNAAKAAHLWVDLARWAEQYGLPPLARPATLSSAAANRLVLVCDREEKGRAFAQQLFHRVWALGEDPAAPQVLTAALAEAGVAPAPALALAGTQGLKDQLKENTAEAAARGAYGVPTFFLGTQMFVGNDRLQFVEQALSPLTARRAP